MKWRSRLVLLLFVLSWGCVSSPPPSAPVSSSDAMPLPEKPLQPESWPIDTSEIVRELRHEVALLRQELQTLKHTSAANLTALIDEFEKRLRDIEEKSKQDLKDAKTESIGLTQDLQNLRNEFQEYKKQIARERVRDGLIIGGICTVVGGIAGGILGYLLAHQ